ncbi:ABC transporter substrate-binding protein [Streptomyces sp. NRRL F-5065]|uniref:ABC transporter substrate-binding protein n=1 Tax=Streptomyces sp. NRRL F-5065 TaxID=1463855 RepID=UPI0004BF62FF|nr:ABC transporter substrate-binding protein [Streptomyces sp. NRRL F-5065]
MPHSRPTRRTLLAAGGALGLGAALPACGTGGEAAAGPGASGATTGPWSFTDDRGTTVRLDARPASLVAFTGVAAALHDYGVRVKGVFGPTTTRDGTPDVQAGDLDVTEVTVLGNEWGRLNVERYAALAPDLLLTVTYDTAGTLWSVPEESKDKIAELAPSLAVSVYDRQLTEPLRRVWELAGALGADLEAPAATAARKRFEDAAARLRAAARARPEIRVLAGSASPELFYVSGSDLSVDLEYFKALGVNLVEPPAAAKKATGGWFESLSWENVDTYPADVIIMDDRSSAIQPADITEATWKRLPAVRAGQVIPRSAEPILSYAKCAPLLERLAEAIEKAEKVG